MDQLRQPSLSGRASFVGANPNKNGSTAEQSSAKKQDKFSIDVDKPQEMNNLLTSSVITSAELQDLISQLFSTAYKDYVGCDVIPTPNGVSAEVLLYFGYIDDSVDNGGATRAFVTKSNAVSADTSLYEKLNIVSSIGRSKVYEITDDGIHGLSKFLRNDMIVRYANSNEIRGVADAVYRDVPATDDYGRKVTYVQVSGLDINKLIAEFFGRVIDGEKFQYSIAPKMSQISQRSNVPGQFGQYTNIPVYLFYIQRISEKQLEKILEKIGVPTKAGCSIRMTGRK